MLEEGVASRVVAEAGDDVEATVGRATAVGEAGERDYSTGRDSERRMGAKADLADKCMSEFALLRPL